MHQIEIGADSQSVQVLKNIDFLLRTQKIKTVLITADYPEESHRELAISIKNQLQAVYGHKIYLLDLANESKKMGLEFELSDSTNTKIFLDELSKHNDYIFIVHNVHKNIMTTVLPEFDIDSALIVRSCKSIGLNKSRYITNLMKDADISILGIVEGRV